jgi:rhodanese-related sulfurtransferase
VTTQRAGDRVEEVTASEPEEWTAGHIADAVHVPLGTLGEVLHDRPDLFGQGAVLIAVCRSGRRSAKASAAIAERGLVVVNLAGGMAAWEQAGLPVTTDTGRPGVVA